MIDHSKLVNGLQQLNPQGGTNYFDPRYGWPIVTPPMQEGGLDIYLEDDMLVIDNKIKEVEKYIEHYGENINKIRFYTDHRHIKNLYPELNWNYYPIWLVVHAFNAEQNKELLCNSFHFKNKTKKFLCLNRNKKIHRDIVCKKIAETYNNNSIWTYHARGKASPDKTDWSKSTYDQQDTWGNIDLTDIYNINANKHLVRNWANVIKAQRLYNETSFSIVNETRNNLPYDFITEKTYQCFITLHPALYVSNKNHVQYIRDWGFDVFDDIFDHSYDSIDDHILRINTMFKDNDKILKSGLELNETLQQRLLKNRQHYLDNFRQILLEIK